LHARQSINRRGSPANPCQCRDPCLPPLVFHMDPTDAHEEGEAEAALAEEAAEEDRESVSYCGPLSDAEKAELDKMTLEEIRAKWRPPREPHPAPP